MTISKHIQDMINLLAKKKRQKPEEYLLELMLSEYKSAYRKDYLLS
jgi:hypothetical protein